MRLLPSAALAMAMATTPAMANMHADSSGVMAFVQRLATQYLVLVSRTFVDLTYDNISVEPGTNHLIITGLTLYPELEWDTEAACEVTIDRVMTGETFSFDTAGTAIELTGVTIPPACLVPEMAGMMSSFGYNGLTADTMSIDIGYHLPTSAADIAITATIVDAADISVSAEFDYLWFRVPIDDPDDDPIPVMQLSQAEISIENAGIWERLEPMVAMQAEQMGGLEAMPQMAQQMIPQALAMGGPPSPEVEAFAQNVSQELARFLQEKNRIVVTAAPEGGVWIDEEIFDSPGNMISALQPMISSSSSAVKAIIPPADMMAAMAEGAAPDAATRLSMGEALLTGIGAPRAVDKGIAMLMPLAAEWNGKAAAMIADAHAANGNAADGYRMALVALASGEASAMGAADTLEAQMDLSAVLQAQNEALNAWPGGNEAEQKIDAAIKAGDVGAMRKLAYAMSVGRGMPRSYMVAYAAATLAAAAGDRGAANLRDRMNARFGTDSAWLEAVNEAEAEALNAWVEDGFGATVAGQ